MDEFSDGYKIYGTPKPSIWKQWFGDYGHAIPLIIGYGLAMGLVLVMLARAAKVCP